MKVIISHDIDHINAWEHSKDLIIPKFVSRGLIEWGLGYVSGTEVKKRLLSLITNQWNQIENMMAFDRQNAIPSTFFVGVTKGCYLSYGKDIARAWIERIHSRCFDIGVHGVCYEFLRDMIKENQIFREISNLETFGIRMHYLRTIPDTIPILSEIGYAFDSSEESLKGPYKVGQLWEFPLNLMDGRIFYKNNSSWQNRNLEEAQQYTKERLMIAAEMGIPYFNILFHDRYFSDEFKTWKN